MKKKISVILISILLLATSIVIYQKDMDVKADDGGGDGGDIGLDTTYVRSIAENLSNIIKNPIIYPENTIAKGRAFGTAGEQYAAERIIAYEMDKIGLWNPNLDPPYLEQIQNIPSKFDLLGIDLTDKLEIMEQNITINNNSDPPETIYLECFTIRPKWNNFLLIFNKNMLTNDFSYSDVEVAHRNYDISDWIDGYIYDKSDSILENFTNGVLNNFSSLMNYLLPSLEDFYDFSFADLEENPENVTSFDWYDSYNTSTRSNDFVFICEDPRFNPNATEPNWYDKLKSISEWLYNGRRILERLLIRVANLLPFRPDCLGIIMYDFNDNTFDMNLETYYAIPTLYINKSIGEEINNSVENFTIDFSFNQSWDSSVESYNVIGQINGTNPEETTLVGVLYDSWWCQGTADAAIGVGMMLSIAKYMKELETEYDIVPKQNVTFVAFSGEEYGGRGAYYYEAKHYDENVVTMIDLNQLGFSQDDPRLIFNVVTNNESMNSTVSKITQETNYVDRTGDTADFRNINFSDMSYFSDFTPFLQNRSTNIIAFAKDLTWKLHHRDGENHDTGDVMDYWDWTDVNVTTEMIWNVTKYFTVDPDCWFSNVTYEAFDSPNDGDTLDDSIRANFTLNTIMPHDLVMIKVYFRDNIREGGPAYEYYTSINYTINSTGLEDSFTFQIPDDETENTYIVKLKLYNSTGRINDALGMSSINHDSVESPVFHLYHPFGYTKAGSLFQIVEDNITGSVFTAHEYGTADNITAYIKTSNIMSPPGWPTYKCMIYRANDSKLIGTTEEYTPDRAPVDPCSWISFSFNNSPVLVNDTEYVLVAWGDNSEAKLKYDDYYISKGRYDIHNYGDPPDYADFNDENKLYSIYCSYTPDTTPPEITNVIDTPDTVGFGFDVTINADVVDDESGVGMVNVSVAFPDDFIKNYSMNNTEGDMYEYNFSDTWLAGQYNYTIWATDLAIDGNLNSSTGHSFNVSAQATIKVQTLKDTYGSGEDINLTDPPENPDYVLVESGRTWDKYLDTANNMYTLEIASGPINYQDENQSWQPINTTIIDADLTISGRQYIYGMTQADYHAFYREKSSQTKTRPIAFLRDGYGVTLSPWDSLKFSDGTNVHGKTQSTAIVDDNMITYSDQYGNGIHLRYVCRNNGVKSDLVIDNFNVLPVPEEDADLVFKETVRAYEFDGFEENRSMSILYGKGRVSFKDFNDWDDNEITTCEEIWFNDEDNNTVFYIPQVYAYDSSEPPEMLLLNKSLHMTRFGNLRVEVHTPYIWLSDINTTYPVYVDPDLPQYPPDSDDGYIRYETGYDMYYEGHNVSSGTVYDSSNYIYIGQIGTDCIPGAFEFYRGYVMFNTTQIHDSATIVDADLTLYGSYENTDRDFDITIQNGQPNSPHMPLLPEDFYYANYSGNGGSLNTTLFNASGSNEINITEIGWINTSGFTKFCFRSSRDINFDMPGPGENTQEYVGVYSANSASNKPELTIQYTLNQSKINNTGSTNISGYLLIQVQFWNETQSKWVVDNDTINETTPRTINTGEQLALDLIFNDNVTTDDLTHGDGTYRVYAAFRDPDGDVLICDDETLLEAWYEFEVDTS